jgi:hypothetical protein
LSIAQRISPGFTAAGVSSAPDNASRATMLLRLFLVARRCTLARLAVFAFTGFDVLAFTRLVAFLATLAFRKLVLARLVALVGLACLALTRFAFTRFAFTFFAMAKLPQWKNHVVETGDTIAPRSRSRARRPAAAAFAALSRQPRSDWQSILSG